MNININTVLGIIMERTAVLAWGTDDAEAYVVVQLIMRDLCINYPAHREQIEHAWHGWYGDDLWADVPGHEYAPDDPVAREARVSW